MGASRPASRLARWGHTAILLGVLIAALSPSGYGRSATVEQARLAPCPDSPNCVSSLATDAAHRIEPLRVPGPPEAARARLLAVLRDLPRVRIVTDEPRYVHAEFTSALLRFVDDVEFRIDDEVIHVRSASRVGYYDFGANRRRIEALRGAL